MKNIKLLNFYFVKFFCFFFLLAYSARSQTLSWLAYGDIRGNLEPCGCDPRTDLGGTKRLASFLAREKRENKNFLIFDLGNNLPAEDKDPVKIDFLQKSISALPTDVSLLNILELKNLTNLEIKANYVLSNSKHGTLYAKKSRPYIKKLPALVFGFVSAQEKKLQKNLESWSLSLEKKIRNIIQQEDKSSELSKVLLFSGTDLELKKIVKAKLFDLIISSNKNSLLEKWTFTEKENPDLLLRWQAQGQSIRMVPLGGVGVLRGGDLRRKKAKSLQEILQQEQSAPKDLGFFAEDISETWLASAYEQGSPLQGLFLEYVEASKSLFKSGLKKRLAQLAQSPYIGAQACKSCHVQSYQKWTQSKHAHAYDTLQKEDREQDVFCVSCHVLGWQKAGFVSLEHSPKFAHVQCENCHGPRKAHAQNPSIKGPVASLKNCKTCHNKTHSPSFDADKYWAQIAHGELFKSIRQGK